jgi:hypothetical protein
MKGPESLFSSSPLIIERRTSHGMSSTTAGLVEVVPKYYGNAEKKVCIWVVGRVRCGICGGLRPYLLALDLPLPGIQGG